MLFVRYIKQQTNKYLGAVRRLKVEGGKKIKISITNEINLGHTTLLNFR
jgi:hypothetical protein